MKRFLLIVAVVIWPTISTAEVLISPDGRIVAIQNEKDWLANLASYLEYFVRPGKNLDQTGPWGKYQLIIDFTVTSDGNISNPTIVNSSGDQSVDSQILSAFDDLRLFPFTEDMGDSSRRFRQPIQWIKVKPVTDPAAE